MRTRRNKGLAGHLGRGLLASLLLHGQVILPLVILALVYGRRESNEVDLSFESVKENELPPGLPTVDEPVPPEKQPREKAAHKLAQSEKKPEPEIEAPPPEKMPPIPKLPEKPLAQLPPPKPEEPPQLPPDRLHQKIVELDMGKDVEAPDNAKYLADKNNRTENETRARETNLEREQAGQEAHPSDDKDKIAGLEDREARPEKRAGQGERPLPESFQPQAPNKVTLSMRGPRKVESAQRETISPDGMRLVPEDEQPSSRGSDGGPAARLRLTRRQYESVFGTDAQAAAALAKAERSQRKGKSSERRERVRSALENFIAEVKPGNQTALNTRAAPFAQFITRMHRKIHELWAFGFMAGMDSKPTSLPLNNPALVAKLEIVLDGQGNVDRVAVVRSSGLTIYDSAAIDVVFSAAPYPTPPPTILSGNGKVYIHWTFHRNEEACGTAGVDYFILNNGPKAPEKTAPASGKNAG
jgi:TonB family protein